jgi:ribosomal protein L22
MADRKGGKIAGDAATKQDKPSAEEGKGPDPKVAAEAAEAKATSAEATPAEKPKKKAAPRKPKAPKAEATAAEETGVGKEEAEAAEKAPAAQKAEPAGRTRARDKAESGRSRRGKAQPSEAPALPVGSAPMVRAHAKYVRTSARKARLVCDHIRGKSVDEAFAILAHTPRHVAEDWRKLLQSAVANAEHNHELLGDDLRIHAVTADEGPTLKRFRPRAMGRATKIRKRTSHLTITLTPKD